MGTVIRCAALAWLAALGVVAAASPARGAPPAATLDGAWTGTLKIGRAHQTGSATATLSETGGVVSGALTLAASDMSGTVTVSGTVRRGKARLAGVLGGQQLRWKGHWVRPRHAWRGTLVMRGAGHEMRGVLGFLRAAGGPQVQCGADYFASNVMPGVFQPICSQCHVPGGPAEHTRLRVTVGDPAATALSAFGLIDRTSPLESLLLLKPRGVVPHGGGLRLAPGSVEDQTLQHWIELVTAPGCGGGGGPTGNLYTDNCAACHGADARGVQGSPDIHCNRGIQDAVRNGRTGPAGIMPAFPTLADADIATIQAFLLDLCPTTTVTGSDLFAGNCATCHATDATGTSGAPSVRCATRVADAVRVGRGPAMPSFARLADLEVGLLETYLGALCDQYGRTGTDLYAGNCASCHGATANGGRSGLGVGGPEIRCTGAGDYQEKVRFGEDKMPAFPALGANDVNAIVTFVHGAYCPGG